ncbi:hypothetical protein [Geminisphaera colitermitum]|uniref:hypothetical protein n=1 Tax=Geminisphaera colitermitum TaxID=1148786 RepID=UPI000158CA7E|nr:hypothetical protein [Geminisphaera colitermitum]
MLSGSSTIHLVVIPSPAPAVLVARGRYIQIVNALGPVLVKVDEESETLLRAGQGIRYDEDFSRIVVRLPDGGAGNVDIWTGYSEFIDRRVDQVEARAVPVPVCPGGIIPANEKIDLSGVATGNHFRRKCVVISNLDGAVALELQNEAGVSWGIVRAGETISHVTSEFIRIKNPATAAVQVRIAEFWYLL